MINQDQLVRAVGCSSAVAARWVTPLCNAMSRYDIVTPKRMASFLAQIGHESANLTRLVENLNYSASGLANTWPKRYAIDPTVSPRQPNGLALMIAGIPVKIANNVYADRMGNGDEASGDGWAYRGRGLIMLTGRENYTHFSSLIGVDLVRMPQQLEIETYAALTAAAFWSEKGLNILAEKDDQTAIRKRVNGGTIGLDDCKLRYTKALKVFA